MEAQMSASGSDSQISAVRAFNRFYTSKLGVLDQHLLKSPFSLSEARVLYELANRDSPAAKEIGIELGLDPGYLSRILQKFDDDGLITRKPLASDRRQFRLDRGDRAVHRGRLGQRPSARRHLPLRPLALCRYRPARRPEIRRADDRGPLGGTGPVDRP